MKFEQFDYEHLNEETQEWEYKHSRIWMNRRAAIDLIATDKEYEGETHLWRVKNTGPFKHPDGRLG